MDRIEPSLLVSGRIDRLIEVGMPEYDDRLEILRIQLEKLGVASDKVQIEPLAEGTDGLNCSQICEGVRRATLISIENGSIATLEIQWLILMTDF